MGSVHVSALGGLVIASNQSTRRAGVRDDMKCQSGKEYKVLVGDSWSQRGQSVRGTTIKGPVTYNSPIRHDDDPAECGERRETVRNN